MPRSEDGGVGRRYSLLYEDNRCLVRSLDHEDAWAELENRLQFCAHQKTGVLCLWGHCVEVEGFLFLLLGEMEDSNSVVRHLLSSEFEAQVIDFPFVYLAGGGVVSANWPEPSRIRRDFRLMVIGDERGDLPSAGEMTLRLFEQGSGLRGPEKLRYCKEMAETLLGESRVFFTDVSNCSSRIWECLREKGFRNADWSLRAQK